MEQAQRIKKNQDTKMVGVLNTALLISTTLIISAKTSNAQPLLLSTHLSAHPALEEEMSLDPKQGDYLKRKGYTQLLKTLKEDYKIQIEPRSSEGIFGTLGELSGYHIFFIESKGNNPSDTTAQGPGPYFRQLKKESRSEEAFLLSLEERLATINKTIDVLSEIIKEHQNFFKPSARILSPNHIKNLELQKEALKDFRQRAFIEHFAETLNPVIKGKKQDLFKALLDLDAVEGCDLSDGQYNVDKPETWNVTCRGINSVSDKEESIRILKRISEIAQDIKSNLLIADRQRLSGIQTDFPGFDQIVEQWSNELKRIDKSENKLAFFNYNLRHRIKDLGGIEVNCENPKVEEDATPSGLRCYQSLVSISHIFDQENTSAEAYRKAERLRNKAFQSVTIVHDRKAHQLKNWHPELLNGNEIEVESSFRPHELHQALSKQPDENSETVQIRRKKEDAIENLKNQFNESLADHLRLSGCDSKKLNIDTCRDGVSSLNSLMASRSAGLEAFLEALNELDGLENTPRVELVLSKKSDYTPVFGPTTKILLDINKLNHSSYWWDISPYGKILEQLSKASFLIADYLDEQINLMVTCDVKEPIHSEQFLCDLGGLALYQLLQSSHPSEAEYLVARMNGQIKASNALTDSGDLQKFLELSDNSDPNPHDQTLHINLKTATILEFLGRDPTLQDLETQILEQIVD